MVNKNEKSEQNNKMNALQCYKYAKERNISVEEYKQLLIDNSIIIKKTIPEIQNSQKNFKEDYAYGENQYINQCRFCKSDFFGFKNRWICKECTNDISIDANNAKTDKSICEFCDTETLGWHKPYCTRIQKISISVK